MHKSSPQQFHGLLVGVMAFQRAAQRWFFCGRGGGGQCVARKFTARQLLLRRGLFSRGQFFVA